MNITRAGGMSGPAKAGMAGRGRDCIGPDNPARPQQPVTTGKRLSDERLQILEKLLQIQKLTNHEIAFALECDERTVRRRRYQYQELGKLTHKHPEVSKNAEKLKPKHLAKLQEWLRDNDDVLLEDMQEFLKRECGLEVSVSTISRQLKRASGGSRKRQHGAKARLKLKRERDAQGRELDYKLRRTSDLGDEVASAAEPGHLAGQMVAVMPPTPAGTAMPVAQAATAIPVVSLMPVPPLVAIGQLPQIPQLMPDEPVFPPLDLGQ